MTTAREIAHRYARKAHMCSFNKHSDRHQDHSPFCESLCKDIEALVQDERFFVYQAERVIEP